MSIDIQTIEKRIEALKAGSRYARARVIERGISTARMALEAGEHRVGKMLILMDKAEEKEAAEKAALEAAIEAAKAADKAE